MMGTHVHMPVDTSDKEPPRQRFSRVTRSGRKLWYELVVLQQPERARACGAGVKGKPATSRHAAHRPLYTDNSDSQQRPPSR